MVQIQLILINFKRPQGKTQEYEFYIMPCDGPHGYTIKLNHSVRPSFALGKAKKKEEKKRRINQLSKYDWRLLQQFCDCYILFCSTSLASACATVDNVKDTQFIYNNVSQLQVLSTEKNTVWSNEHGMELIKKH